MNKVFLPVMLLLGLAQPVCGRQAIDSLRQLLKTSTTDTGRAMLLLQLAEVSFKAGVADSALYYVQEAMSVSRRSGNHLYQAKARGMWGMMQVRANHLDDAIRHFEEARQLLENDTSTAARRMRAKVSGNLSVALGRKGLADRELAILISLVPEFEALHDTVSLAVSLHNISFKLINIGRYEQGYRYMLRNIEMAEQGGEKENTAGSYTGMASLLYKMDSIAAMPAYLSKARKLLDQLPGSRQWGIYYLYSAMYASANGHYSRADSLLVQAHTVIDKFKDRPNQFNYYTGLMHHQNAQHRWKAALVAAAMLRRMGEEDKLPYYQVNALKDMAELEEKLGHPLQALALYKQYQPLKDSLGQQEMNLRINDLEIRHRTLEQEKKILALQATGEARQRALQQARNKELLLASLTCLVLLGVLFGIFYYRNKRKIMRQELEQARQQQRLTSYTAMLEGQEQERLRLARDLHDGLGGTLAALKLRLDQIAIHPSAEAVATSAQRLDTAISDLRQISRNMMPEALLRHGLIEALKDFTEAISRSGLQVQFHHDGLEQISSSTTQLMVYRIVQELATNVMRHARATEMLVQVTFKENLLLITVEDNGAGFDATAGYTGSGLNNVTARVAYLNGKTEVISRKDTGTVINIECRL
ncbi:ATP-binding protein [Taibaiella koreensis]|uniref:ATP-binding protein n=1 Tax=Taibaiella koreensis TaxID=1268548 RepID=UPI0013C2D850|nr:sensor histidine kinase [Taibaiella koreensis]